MLPSGRVLGLVVVEGPPPIGSPAAESPALFATALALLESGDLLLRSEGRPVEPRSLALCDFHGLRAVLTRRGWLAEETIEIACRNCRGKVRHAPCAALELGPFVHRELNHPELDVTLDLGKTHPIPALRLGAGSASEVVLGPLTVGEARPLHEALARRRLHVDEDVVRGMGIAALGEETSPRRIARALSRAPGASFLAILRLFLQAHYPPRLFSIAKCPHCGARNDVDAPYDREFSPDVDPRAASARRQHPYRELRSERPGTRAAFPPFSAFDERARALFEEEIRGGGAEGVALVVDGDVPACDEGGEPLLGSYVPAFEGDASAPSRAAEVSVFYRTFEAIWEEDGVYDWEAELRETIEHELDHHSAHLAGRDEVDEEEQGAIDREAVELVGKRETARLLAGSLARDMAGFLRRTWPLWLLVVFATVFTLLAGR